VTAADIFINELMNK